MSIKTWYNQLLMPDTEKSKILAFVRQHAKPQAKILDVGCGYGRLLKPLQEEGFHVLGVELNAAIVTQNKKNGLHCCTVEAFEALDQRYDVIILSHIIEHFNPTDLFAFLNKYLAKLNAGGSLVIATPLYSAHFYDDFDHVRPYQPTGLLMVFDGKKSQVQYYSPYQLILRDLWFRKGPLLSTFARGKYFRTASTRPLQIWDLCMAILFKITGGLFGNKTGWVGVFQKQGAEHV